MRSVVFLTVSAFLMASCKERLNSNMEKAMPKLPRLIPAKYVSVTDAGFSRNQDTIFYRGAYFSGYLYELFGSGDTASVIGYLNGVQENITRKWYNNQQLAEERLYVDGKKEGIHKAWWPNGKLKFVFEVSDDAYTGNYQEWYNTGRPAKNFHYHNGQEEGSEKMWWPDGTIRANYVIKNGKKYGSIGVKLCINPNDSINKK